MTYGESIKFLYVATKAKISSTSSFHAFYPHTKGVRIGGFGQVKSVKKKSLIEGFESVLIYAGDVIPIF